MRGDDPERPAEIFSRTRRPTRPQLEQSDRYALALSVAPSRSVSSGYGDSEAEATQRTAPPEEWTASTLAARQGRLFVGTHDGGVQEMARIRMGGLVFALLHVFGKLGDRDASQDTDDRDNDHQFDQGKASLQRRHEMKDFRVNAKGDTSRRYKQVSCPALGQTERARAKLPGSVTGVTILVTSRALGRFFRI